MLNPLVKRKRDKFWNIRDELLTAEPEVVLQHILEDDEKNYARAQDELSESLKLFDRVLVYIILHLKGLYSVRDDWIKDGQKRSAIGMLVSAFNFLLLARHSLLLGYYAEARGILRDCYERTSRAWLFSHDNTASEQFWNSEKSLYQKDVDKRISDFIRHPEGEGAGSELRNRLRGMYTRQSSFVHPNLQSFSARTVNMDSGSGDDLREKVGMIPALGGLLGEGYGRLVLSAVLAEGIEAVAIFLSLINDEDGEWRAKYEELYALAQNEFKATNILTTDLKESSDN